MKITVEGEKIIKSVKKLDGIEIVLENLEDAKEAINLILLRTGLFKKNKGTDLKDVRVTSFQKYETTAVDYKMIFLLEFIFEADISWDSPKPESLFRSNWPFRWPAAALTPDT